MYLMPMRLQETKDIGGAEEAPCKMNSNSPPPE